MIRPGLYKHYKHGDLYRVLFLAQTPVVFDKPDEDLVVFTGPDGTIFVGKDAHIEMGQSFLFNVKNSSNGPLVGLCVVYVSLSDGHGRLSVREEFEFAEHILKHPSGLRPPRFKWVSE